MTVSHERARCHSCGTALQGPICHRCGQRQITERVTASQLGRDVFSTLTDLERGFLHTVLELFRRPGTVIRDYWAGKTVCYYRPFRYLLIWTAATILLSFWWGIDDLMQDQFQPAALEQELGTERVAAADQRFDSWLNVLSLLVVPVNSLASFLLFRRHQKTYGEHLVLHGFVMGQLALVGCATQGLLALAPAHVMSFLAGSFLIGAAYNALTFSGVFGEGLWRSLSKGLVVSATGVLAYGAFVAVASAIALRLADGA